MNGTLFKGEIVKVKSFTDPNVEYEVDITNKTCTCPAYWKTKKPCKHIKKVMEERGEIKIKVDKTINGYNIDEVVSALQKEIRRGNEENAVYWGLELLETEGLDWRLWRRLKVIAAEDCAGLPLLSAVGQAEYIFYKIGKNSGDGKLIAAKVIIELCRAKKDRTADDMLCWWIEQRKKMKKLKMPDYAVDEHTKRGRMLGKGEREFWHEGCKLENEDESYNKKYLEYFKKRYPK